MTTNETPDVEALAKVLSAHDGSSPNHANACACGIAVVGSLAVHWAEVLTKAGYSKGGTATPDPSEFIDVVFDGPPSHESGRFVEVENPNGYSIRVGHWIDRGDGFWALRIPRATPDPAGVSEAVVHAVAKASWDRTEAEYWDSERDRRPFDPSITELDSDGADRGRDWCETVAEILGDYFALPIASKGGTATPDPAGVSEAVEAAADEMICHSAGMGSRPRQHHPDDSGLRCTCDEWRQGPGETGLRPWPAFYRHLADVGIKAALPHLSGPAVSDAVTAERERIALAIEAMPIGESCDLGAMGNYRFYSGTEMSFGAAHIARTPSATEGSE